MFKLTKSNRYTNTADRSVQYSDPRPPPADKDALPEGWERAFDTEGDVYFINLDTDVRTYDDPRFTVDPVPSKSLMSANKPPSRYGVEVLSKNKSIHKRNKRKKDRKEGRKTQ